jgi:hypothetical protein
MQLVTDGIFWDPQDSESIFLQPKPHTKRHMQYIILLKILTEEISFARHSLIFLKFWYKELLFSLEILVQGRHTSTLELCSLCACACMCACVSICYQHLIDVSKQTNQVLPRSQYVRRVSTLYFSQNVRRVSNFSLFLPFQPSPACSSSAISAPQNQLRACRQRWVS